MKHCWNSQNGILGHLFLADKNAVASLEHFHSLSNPLMKDVSKYVA